MILIIDDDQHIRLLLRSVLEPMGHQIMEATNGKEALAALQNSSPSLLILDILMPEIDGIELIRNIRRTNSAIPIIAMSGGYSIENVDVLDVAQRLGVTRTLRKPFDIRTLINVVQSLIPTEPINSSRI